MTKTNGIDFLKEQFPSSIRTQFAPTVQRAYSLVNSLMLTNEFMQWGNGKDIIPIIRNAAVEFEFKRSIDKGLIGLEYSLQMNQRKNCHHIELLSGNCVVTISQVSKREALPRKADFRNDLSLSNQIRFSEVYGDSECLERQYAILTHGTYSNCSIPEFLYLGMPYPNVRRWMASLDLLAEPFLLYNEPENIDEEIKLEFKDYLKAEGTIGEK